MGEYKVLIVDDYPENLKLVKSVLTADDINISVATSGKQALSIASVRSFDLILLDIAMPEMDGYEVADKLKDIVKNATTPIIFLTARAAHDDVVKGFRVGAVDYVTKPFNVEELSARINNHLKFKRATDLNKQQNVQLQELLQTKNRLLSIIAKDLKYPFEQNYKTASQLVKSYKLIPVSEQLQLFSGIKQQALAGLELAEKIQEWVQLTENQLKPDFRFFDLNELINDYVSTLQEHALARELHIIYESIGTKEVYADKKMVRRILHHLLSNALKYTEKGGDVIVSIKDADMQAEVTVYDTGIGIQKNDVERLFDEDDFLITPGVRGEQGVGLGLTIVKRYLDLIGGKIWAESTFRIGSDFKFTIPVKPL